MKATRRAVAPVSCPHPDSLRAMTRPEPARADVREDPPVAGLGPGLAFLAATVNARAVVEVGTGSGWGGLWLLRPGGVLALHGVQEQEGGEGPEAAAIRETLDLVRADPRLVPVLLPLGAGLLCATRRP